MTRIGLTALVVLTAAGLAFWLGRRTAFPVAAGAEPAAAEPLSPTRSDRPGAQRRDDAPLTGARSSPPARDAERARSGAVAPTGGARVADLESCRSELERVEAKLEDLERERRATEGDPIPARSDVAPRFQEKPLVAAVQAAFKASGVGGRVDTVDCSEFPCIIYGRVHGDEELVAKLEDSKPLSVYDEDIGVMLTWSSGDHARSGTARTVERKKPQEISLFAFAFYTAADKAKHGDALDRRIRSRTADLWNALHPEDP